MAPRVAFKSQRDFGPQPMVGAPAPTLGHQSHDLYQPKRGCGQCPRRPFCQGQRRASTRAQANGLGLVTHPTQALKRANQTMPPSDARPCVHLLIRIAAGMPIAAKRPRKSARHASVWNTAPPISNLSWRDNGGTHPASNGAARCLQIPTGFWPTAQGWRPSAYLGSSIPRSLSTPTGLWPMPPPPLLPGPTARLNASPGQRPGTGHPSNPSPEKGESNHATFRRTALRSSPPPHETPPQPHRGRRKTGCPCLMPIIAASQSNERGIMIATMFTE
jgi:hypothetical protein